MPRLSPDESPRRCPRRYAARRHAHNRRRKHIRGPSESRPARIRLPGEVREAPRVLVLVPIAVAIIVVGHDWRKMHVRVAGKLVTSTVFQIPVGLVLLTSFHPQIVKAVLAILIIAFFPGRPHSGGPSRQSVQSPTSGDCLPPTRVHLVVAGGFVLLVQAMHSKRQGLRLRQQTPIQETSLRS